jgi:hypothetical protein
MHGMLRFAPPKSPAHVSHTIVQRASSEHSIWAPVRSITTIMKLEFPGLARQFPRCEHMAIVSFTSRIRVRNIAFLARTESVPLRILW